jgi:hypothetical protein
MKSFVKDPDAVLDYTFDWSQWLTGTDAITSSTWIVESPLEIVPASDSFTDTTATVFLSGGEEGSNYTLTNRITTDGSRTDDRTIEIHVRSR